jgi:hypothetical protein
MEVKNERQTTQILNNHRVSNHLFIICFFPKYAILTIKTENGGTVMRKKLSLRIFAALFALVAVTLVMGLYGSMNRTRTTVGNGAISLEAPLFISAAEASQDAEAFPVDKAGISASVKLSTLNIDKIRTIFSKVEDIGDNYIIGIVPIPNLNRETTEVHLYADMDGWLVAYFTKEEPAAKIMKWPENYSTITKITTTTLREALGNAGQAAGVGIPREVKYYDFRFPDANTVTLLVTLASNKPPITQVKIPDSWSLYEASYYGSGVKVDGAQISSGKTSDSYQGAIIVGVLHTIETSGAVATALIYKTD